MRYNKKLILQKKKLLRSTKKMTEIKLLKHNQDLVNEIETAMVFGYHKIFYTEATGLGKSFIMIYLIHKYFKNKKVLYICPKYQIWTSLKNYPEFKLIEECVDMECYADFNSIKDKHFQYDCIFIDEAHHLDTPIQGQNICTVANTILQNNPTTYNGYSVLCKIYAERI